MKLKLLMITLLFGIITACGAEPTEPPTSQLTVESATSTQAPLPTDTAIVATIAPSTIPPTSDTSVQAVTVSFSADVLPILQSRCFNCHGGNETEEGLDLSSFASIMVGSDNGLVITPGDAVNSLLAEQVVSQEMPKRGPKLTPPQVQIIVDWINQGALDN